ncbi:DUF2780 domain-containing protein [Marinobacter sp.]|uniref:DUF2780 domain-containing protein n=1 Tax=Marinobacter sp. TaxID=50741 RepID=UPI003A8D548C
MDGALSSGAQALSPATEINGEARQLPGQLKDQLAITETQAVGGTGALLQLAKNELGTDTMSTLPSKASGHPACWGEPAI